MPVNLDINIISSAVIGWFCFLAILLMVVRSKGSSGVLVYLLQVFFLAGALQAIVLFTMIFSVPLSFLFVSLGAGLLLYACGVFSFVLAIFGPPLSSVRIQILTEIAQQGTKGMSFPEILRRYNRSTIVKQRIHRLVTSGELVRYRKKYALSQRFSPYMIHIGIQNILLRIYR